jgi:VIT1/CCC1 family predicted Fe2+/Mn2+ transporter
VNRHAVPPTSSETRRSTTTQRMEWRVSASIISFFAFVIAAVVWLFFYAEKFDAYQNVAVVVVILLAFVAVMGATWASTGLRAGEGEPTRSIETQGQIRCPINSGP